MNELFMKVLFLISDMGKIKSMSLYKDCIYSNMLAEIDGKLYDISIREEIKEEGKND